ncbi:MAG: RDD family protein [Treponema sp.]|jgi:uncharacterized RDD family membrane protein YckC|nr:RDD family protein [Treponema sp.]
MPRQRYGIFDSSLEALTPEGIEFVLSPAGLPVRTLAYGIDKVTQWLILMAIFVMVAVLHDMGIWLALILNFLIDWFYHVVCELTFHGQTLGKRLAGIRVVRSNGAPVDPASSFLRNLLRFADTFFFFFPIALVSITASRGFRRLGDWAGDTLVVYSSMAINLSGNTLNRFLEKYEPVSLSHPLSQDEKQAVMSFARRYPLLGEARANEIAGIYAPYLKDRDEYGGLSDAVFLLGIARKLGMHQLSGETK